MNLFNRVVMVIILLLATVFFMALIFTVLLFPGPALDEVRSSLTAVDENLTMGLQIITAAVAALFAVVSFLLLVLEVIPRSAKGVQLTGVTGATAELTIDAIINRIRYETGTVPSVRFVKPTVHSKGKQIDVDLQLRTDPTIDVAAKTEEVSQIVRDTVENKMGIHLGRLRVFVYHEPYPRDSAKRGTQPSQPAPPDPTSTF